MASKRDYDYSNLTNLVRDLGDDCTCVITNVNLPSSLETCNDILNSSYSELDSGLSHLKDDLEACRSSQEFWMATWKSSPYAILPLISISAIVAYFRNIALFPCIILIPIAVTSFILTVGYIGWKRTKCYAKHISRLKKRIDDVEREIKLRETLMSEFFKTQRLELDKEDFRGYRYPHIEQLPTPLGAMETIYILEGRVSGPYKKTGRYSDVAGKYPELIKAFDEYKEAKENYNTSVAELYDLVDRILGYKFESLFGHHRVIVLKGLLILSDLGFNASSIPSFASSDSAKMSNISQQQIDFMKRMCDPKDCLYVLNDRTVQMKAFDVDGKTKQVADAKMKLDALRGDYFGAIMNE